MLRIGKSGLIRKNAGFTLLETIVVVVVLAILAAVAVPSYAAVITRANDKSHLSSLQAIAEATQVSYANGADGMTWTTALASVLSSGSTAAGNLTILAAAPTAAPTSGPSLQTTQISYALTTHGGGTLAYTTDELGLASQNPSGNCSMVITSPSGLVDSWVAGKLGANCTGTEALAGRATVDHLPYLAPSDYGPPHPITNLSTATQSYDPVSKTISGPTFTFTPSTSGDVASVEVKRNGVVVASLDKSANSYTDTTATPATSYNYSFTVIDNSDLSSTTVTQAVDTKPGALLGGTLTYLINAAAADVTLSWTAPNPTAKINGYHIYRDGTLIDTVTGAATTSATLLSQPLGTLYTYDVLPYNSAGDGLGFQVAQTLIATPLAPATLTATALDAKVNLTWTPVNTTTAAPVTGYYLYRSLGSAGPYTLLDLVIGANASSYQDTTAVNGNSYSYKVASYGVAGTGALSDPTALVTPIGAPVAGTVGTPALALGSVSFSINFPTSAANPIDHFTITRSGVTLNSNYTASATSYTDNTITPGDTYTYSVTAVNSSGSSPTATTPSVTTITAPVAPTLPTPTPADGQVTLSWSIPTPTAQAPVSGYRIYSSSGGPFTLLTQVSPATTLNYTDTAATNGTSYSYEIESYGAGGTSARSPATNPVTPLGSPAPVTITTALAPLGGGSVTVGFSSVSTPTNPVTSITVTRNGSAYTTLTSSATSFTDTTTTNGVGYIYAITTHNALYSSTPVSTSTLTPFGTAPAPSIATATASDAKTTLTWAKITSTSDTPVDGYRLYRSINSSPFTLLTQITPATQISYNDTALTNGASYAYELSAYGDGGESSRSAPSTTLTPLGTPAAIAITSATPASGGSAITVNFTSASTTANPVSSITLTRNGAPWRTLPSSASTFTDSSITNGVSYIYAITTHNAISSSTPVATASLTAYAIAQTPSFTSLTPADSSIAINWSQVAATTDTPVDGYRLYQSVNGGPFALLTQVLGATTTNYTATGLINGTDYSYQVTAYGSGGESPRSGTSATIRPLGTPLTPTITSAAPASGGGAITVNFTTTSTTPAPVTSITVTRNGSPLLTLTPSATSFTDSTVANGTSYTYAITANNAIASSAPATTSSITALAVAAIPTFTSATVADSQVNLSWGQISTTSAAPVSGYRLYRSTAAGPYILLTQVANTTSYSDASAVNGTTYRYQVTAFGAGGESTYSTPTAALTPIGAPSPVTITTASTPLGGGSATVTFASISTVANPVTSITVTRNGSAYLTLTPYETTFTDSTVTNGNTYTYAITANNSLYSSTPTYTSALAPFGTAPAPSFATASAADSQVSLTWAAIPSTTAIPVDGYRIYRQISGGPFTLLTQLTPSTTTSYTDTGLTNGTSYAYQLTAYGSGGESVHSVSSTTLTPLGAPAPVTITSATPAVGGGSITVNFTTTSTTSNPISSITVTRNGSAWRTLSSSSTSFTDATITNGAPYIYAITTHNSLSASALVSTSSLTAYAVSTAPNITSATPANAQVTLAWTQVPSTTDTPVDGYRIYRSTSGGAFTLLTQVLGSATTTYLDSSALNGVSYSYELASYGSGGQSPNSAACATVTPVATPTTPTISSATVAAGGSSITINFTTTSSLTAPITSIHISRNGSALATLAANATSYTDSAITNGTPYIYSITASNALFTSPAATTSTLTAYTVPTAPTFTAATAANTQVSLTWSQATSTTATPVTGYRLYRSNSGGAYTLLTQLTPVATNSYTDSSVTNGVNYSYQVSSYGSGGESTASTPTATLTPLGAPAAPVISSATAASGGGSITVNFTQAASSTNPVTSITVTRNGSAYTTLTPSSTSFTDATVANGSSYTYTLTANNALYSSSATSTAALTPTAAPAAPSFTTTTPGSNQVSLAWSAVASTSANPVTGYRLYVSLNSGAYTLLATQASTSYTDSSALNGNSYSYRVEAYGSGGTSAQATSTTVTPSGLPTSAPTITSTPTSISATTLNWSAVTSTSANPVTGYTLQRSTTSSSGPWTTIYTGSLLSYNATGLSTGNSYYYRVAATNATGSGNYSSSAFYTPGATPVIYSVTPGNASATLTFSGMTIAQGEYLQSVALLACSDQAMSANCVNTYIDIQPMASYTVYYLNNGTPYYFKSIYTTTLRTVSSAVVGSFTPNAPPAYPPAFTYTNPTNSSNQTLFNFPAAITSIAAPVTTTGIQFCQDQVMTSGCVSYNFSNSTTSLLVNLSTNFPTGSMLQGRLFATNWMGTTYGYPENITAYNPAPTALAPTVTSATSYYINLSWPQVPSTQAAPVTNLYVQYCADAAMTTSCNTTSWINPPVTSTTIWYLSANTTYYFRIEVVGASTTYGPVTRGSTTP